MFIDFFDIKELAYSEKDMAKDEYKEYRRELKESGYIEVKPFREWFIETYGHEPTTKGYLSDLQDDERHEIVRRMLNDFEYDLEVFADIELEKIRDKIAKRGE